MSVASNSRAWVATTVTLFVLAALAVVSASAQADTPGPGWYLTGRTYPTNLPPGGEGKLVIDVFNVGEMGSSGPITFTDILPEGVTATEAGNELWLCTGNGPGAAPHVSGATAITCTNNAEQMPSFAGGGGHPNGVSGPNHDPEVPIEVKVAPGASEGVVRNRATIVGGGASTPASTEDPIEIGARAPSYGYSGWSVWYSNADGTLDTQAGSHPYEATFNFDMNTVKREGEAKSAGGEFRNLTVDLPPGLVGNPTAVPQCTRQQLVAEDCPSLSMVGTITLAVSFTNGNFITFEVYNMVPPGGIPAEFAFNYNGIVVYLDSGVRSGSDYGISTHVDNSPQREVIGSVLTLWGVPTDKSHDTWRANGGENALGGGCSQGEIEHGDDRCTSSGLKPSLQPFLTLPTACDGAQRFSIRSNSWQEPIAEGETSFISQDSQGNQVGYTGCERLGFAPSIAVSTDTASADTPAGLSVDVKPTIDGLNDPEGIGTADIRDTTVTLPRGVAINPGQAAGLQACPETEATLKENDEAPVCPGASKVGTDEIETPLLRKPLQGDVYIMQSNPPEIELLLTAEGEGVNLKLVGHVHLHESTGQLTSTFSNTPELPFTNLRLSFSGGAQAALATPTSCGTYTTTSDFTPWSTPYVSDVFPSSSFEITSGSGAAPCPSSPLPFAPQLSAGSTTDQAGGFTDFSLLLQAPDDQQRIQRLRFKTPEGLLGMISKIQLCTNAQAEADACPQASQIGHTVVASGPGPYPLVVPQPGQPSAPIYLTESYEGAPYGLSIVVPLHVGPFVLPTQRVRAKIEVDPLTSQLTVTTDPLPQVIAGVPTDLRSIDAVIDRPGFMFNPTSCSPMSFSGTAWGTPPPGSNGGTGAVAPISSHFQMGSCQALKFKPNFKVSTAGKTSRKNGASLDVKLTYPTGALGHNQASSQSNIASVKVDLPKQLPSRLTTLQKACTSATFEANPAACPPASRVGQVTAITPVLPVPLTGPAIFVSYGGAKFPELVFVLQGYGVTVYVHAETFISKAGITSSTLRRVPDVPIASFELKLPEGPFSALAANGNLCQTKLRMPTAFIAQNGAVIHQSTPVGVTGCAKVKHKAAKKPKRQKKKRK